MTSPEQVRETLVRLITLIMPEGFRFPHDKPTVHLVGDLGMDSLSLVSLIMLCEQEFDVKISEDPEFLLSVATVGAAVEYLVAARGKASA